jgi:two-component system, NarL family, response regulator NreC
MRYQIYIVEDHPLMREGYAGLIGRQADMELCGEAASGVEALSGILERRPDAVIADISLGGSFSGLELTKRLLAVEPGLRILAVSALDEASYAERALRAGALGFVSKGEPVSEVVQAIRKVAEGHVYVAERLRSRFLRRFAGQAGEGGGSLVGSLSDRELETFELIGRGLMTKQIAEAMVVSPKTIETYRANIKAKLGLETSAELARSAATWVADSLTE